jgi:nucleotide-binding universal stress UspA family protein
VAERNPTPIVVGVDGTDGSTIALDWAATEAALRGCIVHAVSVAILPDRISSFADRVAAQVAAVSRRHPSVLVRQIRLIGAPAPVLARTARGSSMLVVGSHGTGRAGRVLLGSVSTYCARHASCPAVIVSTPERPATVGSGWSP